MQHKGTQNKGKDMLKWREITEGDYEGDWEAVGGRFYIVRRPYGTYALYTTGRRWELLDGPLRIGSLEECQARAEELC